MEKKYYVCRMMKVFNPSIIESFSSFENAKNYCKIMNEEDEKYEYKVLTEAL